MDQTSQTEVVSTVPATDETRKILPIVLVVLIDVLGLMIILPLLPFYSEEFGATPFMVGMLISIYALCQLVSAPLLGRWSDHVGRKPLLIVSQVGTCLGFPLLAFANSLPLIFLSRIIDGLTAGNISLAQAYISDVTRPEKRAAAFGKIAMAFGIGFFLGPSLTSFLFQFGPKAPILAAAFLSFCSIVCTATLRPGGKVGTAAQAIPQARPQGLFAFGIYRKYFVSPRLRSLLVQIFIFYFTFSAYIYGFALFAERRFTYAGKPLNPQQIGYAFAYFGLIGIILQGFLLGPLVRRFGERRLVLYSFTACIVGYLAYSFIDGPLWIAVPGLFTSFGNGILRPGDHQRDQPLRGTLRAGHGARAQSIAPVGRADPGSAGQHLPDRPLAARSLGLVPGGHLHAWSVALRADAARSGGANELTVVIIVITNDFWAAQPSCTWR